VQYSLRTSRPGLVLLFFMFMVISSKSYHITNWPPHIQCWGAVGGRATHKEPTAPTAADNTSLLTARIAWLYAALLRSLSHRHGYHKPTLILIYKT
jgi:hypothetical protein